MNPLLLTAIISAAISFGGAWQIQNWRMDAKEKEHVESKLAQEQEARRFDTKRTSAAAAAQSAGTARQIVLRADADASRNALDSLRIASARAVSAARADPVACVVTAAAQSVVLDQCATEYQALAGIADRHASDIQVMQDTFKP